MEEVGNQPDLVALGTLGALPHSGEGSFYGPDRKWTWATRTQAAWRPVKGQLLLKGVDVRCLLDDRSSWKIVPEVSWSTLGGPCEFPDRSPGRGQWKLRSLTGMRLTPSHSRDPHWRDGSSDRPPNAERRRSWRAPLRTLGNDWVWNEPIETQMFRD